MKFFLFYGVKESDAMCLKADASVRIGTWGSIFQVALDAAAHMCQLATYLMVPASEEFHLQQMVAVGVCYMPVTQSCQFCLGAGFTGDETLIQFFIPLHPVFKKALGFRRSGAA